MFRKIASVAATGFLALCLTSCGGSDTDTASTANGSGSGGKGTIAVITVDLANSYWQTEADTAKAEIEKAGYQATVNAHNADPDKQNQLIDTAISNKVKAIILDPAGADESVPAVRKATDAGIPVFVGTDAGGSLPHGLVATEVAHLAQAGFTDVTNVRGGFGGAHDQTGRVVVPGWRDAGLPVETGR